MFLACEIRKSNWNHQLCFGGLSLVNKSSDQKKKLNMADFAQVKKYLNVFVINTIAHVTRYILRSFCLIWRDIISVFTEIVQDVTRYILSIFCLIWRDIISVFTEIVQDVTRYILRTDVLFVFA